MIPLNSSSNIDFFVRYQVNFMISLRHFEDFKRDPITETFLEILNRWFELRTANLSALENSIFQSCHGDSNREICKKFSFRSSAEPFLAARSNERQSQLWIEVPSRWWWHFHSTEDVLLKISVVERSRRVDKFEDGG